MATDTVRITGGPLDGRWQKVPRGATSANIRGTDHHKNTDGTWSPTAAAQPEIHDEHQGDDVDDVKPAPRKRKSKAAQE